MALADANEAADGRFILTSAAGSGIVVYVRASGLSYVESVEATSDLPADACRL